MLCAIAAFLLWQKSTQTQRQASTAIVPTAPAAMGTMQKIMRISGSTAARNFASIVAPMMRGPDAGRALVLIKLAKSGSLVKKGELLAQIDAQSVKDHVDDLESYVQQADADIKKRKAEQAIEMENLRQTVRAAKAAADKARLDRNAAEIRTSIDRELLQLAVDETDATYKQVQANLAITEQKHKSEIRILEYTRDRHARHRDRHKHDIEKFTVFAPINGLVVMQSIFRGGEMGQVQEGDQVSPGQPFMKVVDSNSMQLEAFVNQVESESIRIGQSGELSFDAFPGFHLQGKVQSVGAMGVGGWRQNYFIRNIPVKINIQGGDPRVIPDLSASADVVLERDEKAVLVPIEAVNSENGKLFVYVKNGDEFRVRQVEVGATNNTQASIRSGLKAGDEVALRRPVSQT